MPTSTRGLVRPYQPVLAIFNKLLDAAVIAVSYVLLVDWTSEGWQERETLTVFVAVVLFFISGTANNLYHSWRIGSVGQELKGIGIAWALAAFLMVIAAQILSVTDQYTPPGTIIWLIATPVPLVIWRFIFRLVSRELRRRGHNTRRAAIVGATDIGLQLATFVEQMPWTGLRLVGFFDDRSPAGGRSVETAGRYPLVGDLVTLVKSAEDGDVDVIFIALPFKAETRVREFISDLTDTTASVYLVQDFTTFELLQGRWLMLGEIPVVSIHETPFYGVGGWVKRIEDILLATVIGLVILIPCLVIAVAVRVTSPGPVLFKQRRFGLNGKEIVVWKFRSMVVCEDSEVIPQAQRNDPRVTPLGRFLRRTSLDELPQFMNVLQGTMSVVGPRPHAMAHNQTYRSLVASYMLRHKVKPGITGWAQINGWRGECEALEDMQKRVEFDLEYIRNWSMLLDIKIIARTILNGFTGEKAY